MKTKKHFGVYTTIAVIILAIGVLGHFLFKDKIINEIEESNTEVIYFWYTDDSLTDYVNSIALSFYDENGIKVVPVLKSGLEYLEEINDASVSGNEVPDIYVIGTDYIEKAALSGLAMPAVDERTVLSDFCYPKVALDSIKYHDDSFGYPFYYETAYLLYNKTYLKYWAADALRRELANLPQSDYQAGEDEGMADITSMDNPLEAPEGIDEAVWEQSLETAVKAYIPASVQDMIDIGNNNTTPPNVESILSWDISDIFYNYFFTGAYMNLGGRYGDDKSIIEICNDYTITCMKTYQNLNTTFSIDSESSNYESVIDDFIKGKTIYTIATTDAIAKLEKAKADGTFEYEYSVAKLPAVDNEHIAKGLSYTSAIVVNGYSEHRVAANKFAVELAYFSAQGLYERTGKMPAAKLPDDFEYNSFDVINMAYSNSVSLPKVIQFSNFWLKLEQAYTEIWNGKDPKTVLEKLDEEMREQTTIAIQ